MKKFFLYFFGFIILANILIDDDLDYGDECTQMFSKWGVRAVQVDPSDKDIDVVIVRGVHATSCEHSAGCASVYTNSDTGEFVRARIDIIKGFEYNSAIMAHEIGHVLGFGHDTIDMTNVMYHTYHRFMPDSPSYEQRRSAESRFKGRTLRCTIIDKR